MLGFFPESLGAYRLEIMWTMSRICKDRATLLFLCLRHGYLVLKEEVDSLWLL